jgi:hypothetical protein
LVISLNRLSPAMAEATATRIFSSAGRPKITMPKIETGASAISIFRIRTAEFTGEAI